MVEKSINTKFEISISGSAIRYLGLHSYRARYLCHVLFNNTLASMDHIVIR